MSRAFVKEQDGDELADGQPELPQSPHPNYVRPQGLAKLKARLAALQQRRCVLAADPDDMMSRTPLAQLLREARYVEARIERAILVDPAEQPAERVAFGASVEVADEDGRTRCFTIVGEDEAEPEHGLVSWVSPLARALIDAEVGDLITWERPSGALELEVLSIRYGS
jgi:transcription elongation GreA/GreB family factor